MSGKYSVVYITGASGGIGRELAWQLAKTCSKIAIFARSNDKLRVLSDEIKMKYGEQRVFGFPCDVSVRSHVIAAFQEAKDLLGPPDLLIANAGIGRSFPAKKFEIQAVYDIYQTNVFGVLHCLEAVLPLMLEKKTGHIVGISSLAAYRSFPYNHTYCASKSALSAHLEGLRTELRRYGVKVTTICPGFIKTPMTDKNNFPMPFLMSAEQAACRILEAIKQNRKVYNFPWQTHWLVRLSRLVPDKVMVRLYS